MLRDKISYILSMYKYGAAKGWLNDEALKECEDATTDLTTLIEGLVPEKLKILDLNADIQTEGEYVRHKERVVGHNICIDQFNKNMGIESN